MGGNTMITLRTLKENEKPDNIIPEIINAFVENPQEDVVQFAEEQFANTEEESFSFKITRHQCSIYQQLDSPALKAIYFNFLIINQASMHYSQPEFAALVLEQNYETIKQAAVNEYLANLVGNYHTC